MELEEIGEGDLILFNDRKIPLKVETAEEERAFIKGPQGGEYVIFRRDGETLVSSRGSRRYATRVKDLREIGEWRQVGEGEWRHTKSGKEIELSKNDAGFWTIETELEANLPKYGFSEREFAEEEVEKLMEANPEG